MIIPPRKGVNQSQDEYLFNHQENTKGQENQFFSRGSRACRHVSPRCVDQHLVVRQLRGVLQTSSTTIGHHKNLSTSEVTQ